MYVQTYIFINYPIVYQPLDTLSGPALILLTKKKTAVKYSVILTIMSPEVGVIIGNFT